ncbi:DELLA protein RGL2-like [Sesamum indicum]|uniref:DELLA protein RGL2-like n=1 Tax=Sesamum indicum TaxID=4182 RepID=A0A6I9SVY7_SESIN|nr:DELLA protein RGL2-like [Sesamum indicum]
MFTAKIFDSRGVPNESSVSSGTYNEEAKKSSNSFGVEGWEDTHIDTSGDAAELGHSLSEVHRQLRDYKEFGNLDDLYLDVVSPPLQSCNDNEIRMILGIGSQNPELIDAKQKGSYVLPMRSFELLRRHGIKRSRLEGQICYTVCQTQSTYTQGSRMSTENIIELAAENFVQPMSKTKEISVVSHPYPSSITLDRSDDNLKAVQLVQNLLLSAEKLDEKKYEQARKILEGCDRMSSSTGTPIQRLVFYFTGALYEKIDRENGTVSTKGLGKQILDPLEDLQPDQRFQISFHKNHPLCQITQFSAMQAVIDHVAEATKIHVIDLDIRSGVQSTILMQALVGRQEHPVQHLTITAVGTKSKALIEQTGKRLMAFAESLKLKFSFHIVMVADILELNENLFELNADEAVAVYAAFALTYMIAQADQLEHIMRVIKNIKPCVMIVVEIDTNCNSPTFVWRFVEALFFYGAFFDSLAECMKNDETNRRHAESTCFRSSIRNIVAAEGGERRVRLVDLSVWRAFFTRFGLVELELSMSSLYQAHLLRQSFPCHSSCTLGMNGKCLTIGWKGTPLCTLSAWKFQRDIDE